MLEILLGQIPEAIYFALFMIFTKRLKEKRLLFVVLMVCEYLLLKQFLHFNVWFHILYTTMTFVILKILYKEKSQIVDVFTFTIGSFTLILISLICILLTCEVFKNAMIGGIINRVLMFTFLFSVHNHLYKIQNLYKKLWNRNDDIKKKMKSTTFRCVNLAVFNVIFYIINIGMFYCILLRK